MYSILTVFFTRTKTRTTTMVNNKPCSSSDGSIKSGCPVLTVSAKTVLRNYQTEESIPVVVPKSAHNQVHHRYHHYWASVLKDYTGRTESLTNVVIAKKIIIKKFHFILFFANVFVFLCNSFRTFC